MRIFNCQYFKKHLDLELTTSSIILGTADTLRYYKKVGAIPHVTRTAGGISDYGESDISWVKNAKHMRSAGLSIEFLIEYQRVFNEGEIAPLRRGLICSANS